MLRGPLPNFQKYTDCANPDWRTSLLDLNRRVVLNLVAQKSRATGTTLIEKVGVSAL